jgi:hypothetical protein
MFHLGKLDEASKILIREQRSQILRPHSDRHLDKHYLGDPRDMDSQGVHADRRHEDDGIGVDFPLRSL